MKLAVTAKDGAFDVWAMLRDDDYNQDPTNRGEAFLIGTGSTAAEAVASAKRDLETALEDLAEWARKFSNPDAPGTEGPAEDVSTARAAMITLSSSEIMALRDILAEYLRQPDHREVFVDVSRGPIVETTPEQLLVRLLETPRKAVIVHGIWLLRLGDRVEVLAETEPGRWRRVITEPHDAAFSHCVHPEGIRTAPWAEFERP